MSDRSIRRAIASATAVLLAAGPLHAAVPHMARTEIVADQLATAAKLRAERIQVVRDALQLPQAREEAARRHVKVDVLSTRVATLSDRELEDLAKRSQSVKDVVSGHRGGDDTLVIVAVLFLVAALVVLAAVYDWDDYYDDDCYCY